jgi:mannose-6-phosphate isomerase-like protein (cupin superfamily)
MHRSRLQDREPFTTLDGSTIREVAHPAWTAARHQSLAEATVPARGETAAHLHRVTEELYFFTAGHGRMRLGDEEFDVAAGDCVVIPPGTEHALVNAGDEPLVLLCCCAPAYAHEDTVITGAPALKAARDGADSTT